MTPATVVIDRMMCKTGKTIDDLRERNRQPEIVLIRHKLMRDLYHEAGWSVSAIGRLLHRNHATVIHAVMGSRNKTPRYREHIADVGRRVPS